MAPAQELGHPPPFAIGLMARDGKPTGTQDQMMPCATARHRVAPSLAQIWDRDSRTANQPSGVLGVQPLLGHPVLHVHSSVSLSKLNNRIVCQAHQQIAVGTANNAKLKGLSITIFQAC